MTPVSTERLPTDYLQDIVNFSSDPDAVKMARELLSLRASPTDGELVKRLRASAELHRQWDKWELGCEPVPEALFAKDTAVLLDAAASNLSAKERTIDELGAADRVHLSATQGMEARLTARAEAAESALSTAEARGLERAAKVADRAVEHFATKQAEAKSRKAKVEARDFESMRFAAIQIADGIRASALSTNEAGE